MAGEGRTAARDLALAAVVAEALPLLAVRVRGARDGCPKGSAEASRFARAKTRSASGRWRP